MEEMAPSAWDAVTGHAVSVFVRESLWAYPILETIHVIGLALVFAPILLFDLRVLGFYADTTIAGWHAALLPWVYFGFALNASSGALMFASDAAEFAGNRAFQVKLMLLAAAGINAVLFQTRLFPAVRNGEVVSATSKASAIASIVLWLAIITAGRMMAYIK